MSTYKNSFSERVIIGVLATLMLVAWLFDQISLIAAIVITVVLTVMLIQSDMNRRMESVLLRRKVTAEARKTAKSGIQSVRAAALNSLPTPVLIIGKSQRILLANDAARTLLGETIVGEDAFLYLRNPTTITAVNEALRSGWSDPQTNDNDTALQYTSTDDRAFDLTLAPVKDEEADTGYNVIVFFYEVTSLLRSEQMRVDFVANASHELRTPLSSLIGSIETLQGPAVDDPEAQQRFLNIMQREAERMIRLIDDLLSLSRIEMSRHKTPQHIVDIQLAIKNSIHVAEPIAKKRGIEFQLDLDDRASLVIADSDQITQVLLNLLVNDAKYADENTKVFVTTRLSPTIGDLVLTIRDEGPGIAAEHLGRLTERFYRVDTARSRKMGGTGLGLAIVKHILLRHGTQLEIKSRLGTGTTFSFRLPLAEPKTVTASSDHQKDPIGARQS